MFPLLKPTIIRFTLLISVVFLSGCSVRKLAITSFANALTEGSASSYARDDDPKLIGEALPFALKTMETLLETVPEHKGLLISTAAGFVRYAHAYILRPAVALEFSDLEAARHEKLRARRLFERAYRYGLRALSVEDKKFPEEFGHDAEAAVESVEVEDVAALYWTGVALGSAISVAKNDMALVAELPKVEALLRRALTLDEGFQNGAIHEFFIIFESGSNTAGSGERADEHFRRALQLSDGRSITPLVTYAESVCVRRQSRQRFKELLEQALAFDTEQSPGHRLSNILAQQKAETLLTHIDDFFFLDQTDTDDLSISESDF